MAKYDKIIFVCSDNTCRSPVAAAILKKICRLPDIKIESRGLICLFPEPYNPKATALLRSRGIVLENGVSRQLTEEDFDEKTLILVMEREQQDRINADYANARNVYTIMEFAGGKGDIIDPYGGDMDVYAMFFESIDKWVNLIENTLYKMEDDQNDSIGFRPRRI
ncbi:MAG: phosphotyrosine protein phosphatase [Butyrivibrio sp.]|nr:phosphotyrosine protein phosphatase [Butyrivibrio sp.]